MACLFRYLRVCKKSVAVVSLRTKCAVSIPQHCFNGEWCNGGISIKLPTTATYTTSAEEHVKTRKSKKTEDITRFEVSNESPKRKKKLTRKKPLEPNENETDVTMGEVSADSPKAKKSRKRPLESSNPTVADVDDVTRDESLAKKKKKVTRKKSQESPDPNDVTGDKFSADSQKIRKKRKLKKLLESEDPKDVRDELSSGSPKIKKKKRKKSDQDIQSLLLGPFIPFEGSGTDNLQSRTIAFDRWDSPEGRFYHLQSSTISYSFPSVTTILDKTVERGSDYGLKIWKQKLIEKHGQKGFDAIVKNTLKSGSDFHKELERRLMRSPSRTVSTKLEVGLGDSLHWLINNGNSKNELHNVSAVQRRDPSHLALQEVSCKNSATQGMSEVEDEVLKSKKSHGENCDTPEKLHHDTLTSNLSEPIIVSKKVISDSIVNQERHASAEEVSNSPQYMQSIGHVLEDMGEVKALETATAHIALGYMGTFDCLAEYQGELCLIDWKTSNRLKPSLADCYDYPLQAVAYAGAVNQDPSIQLKVLNMLIVIAYASGEPAHAHFINHQLCLKYWLKWLYRLQTYQTRFSEDLSEIIS